MVERDRPDLSLVLQADLLGLNRSGLYYQPVPPSLAEVRIKNRIDELYTACPFYGSRRITQQLCRDGIPINRKAVQRHMQEMGIAGICPGPNLSKRNADSHIYPYLLRSITASYPNHVWGIDITYIRLTAGWMFLVAVLDWFSRYVVSWALDQTLEIGFVLDAAQQGLAHAMPLIWNSDQGSHVTSPQYTDLLLAANVQISMDSKGRALDNIFTERLWRTVKYENVYLKGYTSPREARHGIATFLAFYNDRRLHQALDYHTPAEIYYRKGEDSILSLPLKLS